MNTRRQLIKSAIACMVILKTGLMFPIRALAEWPGSVFEKDNPDDALAAMFGDRPITESDRIQIDMPPGAENGAIVPITVKTDLQGVQSISLIAEKNPVALLAQIRFSGKGKGDYFRTRIKLAKSSHVIVVVEADGELCMNQRYIEVLKGGCD